MTRTTLWLWSAAAAAALGGVVGGLAVALAPGSSGPTAEMFAYRSGRDASKPLPILWQVPAFSFPDQMGRTVTDQSLSGHIWIADFMFTTCTSVCPMLSAKFAALQRQISSPDLRFVSISVDPTHDTPAALAAYAGRYRAGESRWLLLSTADASLADIAQGFHVAVEPSQDAQNPILHTSLFFLIDEQGQVRGIYDSDDERALTRLRADTVELLENVGGSAVPGITPRVNSVPLPASGAALYAALDCAACHDNSQVAPPLAGVLGRDVGLSDGRSIRVDAAYLAESILSPGAKQVAGYLNLMPAYGQELSKEQVDALVDYISGLSAPAAMLLDTDSETAPVRLAETRGATTPQAQRVSRSPVKGQMVHGATPSATNVAATTSSAVAELGIDPVCHMNVRVTPQTLHAETHGHTYYFCSESCRSRFAQDPEQFLQGAKPAP